MANEVTINAGVTIVKNGMTIGESGTLKEDLVSNQMFGGVQSFAAGVAELVVFPSDLVTAGITWILLRNLSTVNFITIAQKTGGNTNSFETLKPGRLIPIHNPTAPGVDPG